MVGVPGKYKGCETCRRRRVKVLFLFVTMFPHLSIFLVLTPLSSTFNIDSAATKDPFAATASQAAGSAKAMKGLGHLSQER